jgi:hypothetical protein
MTAKIMPPGVLNPTGPILNRYDLQFLTEVVKVAERAGKQVKPIIVPTNDPTGSIVRMAADLKVHELLLGPSSKFTAEEQMGLIGYAWLNLHHNRPVPLTVRIVAPEHDVHLDLGGGNRIPTHREHLARSVAELRRAGIGVHRILLYHDGSASDSELFQAVLTMIDPHIELAVATPALPAGSSGPAAWQQDLEEAQRLGRPVEIKTLEGPDASAALATLVRAGQHHLLILRRDREAGTAAPPLDVEALLKQAPCRVLLVIPPSKSG